MKPKAYELLQNAKSRAFQQIQFALKSEQRNGNYGSPYKWHEDGETKECFAYNSNWYALRLMDWCGEPDQPCFYNLNLGKWDTVYNMPIEQLVSCADHLLRERTYRRMNNE